MKPGKESPSFRLNLAKFSALTSVLCFSISWLAATAQEAWEALPDVPFPFGVSTGGGLTTDGTNLYAADFSGDGNNDFIDLDEDGAYTSGEYLDELGIPNGSVRFARFDPATNAWEALPTLHPAGIGGDAFSSGDLNHTLFHAGGSLFYYQFRGGPNRCALYRYDLSQGLAGAWSEVWDLSTSESLISVNGGLAGVDAPGGPVIFHHKGGGAYEFARSTGLTSGSPAHLLLTPSWPYTSAHFPRNGAWAYDLVNDRLFHMSGDQLIRWDASAAYAPDGLLDAIPDGTNDLAVASTAIDSLSSTLGWHPGGSAEHPGASLWGNSIVVVNDPTGIPSGPGGEDTGDNVLYLVRGETSVDGWPFNEGRGLANNGDFARYFPASGASQNLPAAPFHIGKGSAACYVNDAIYVLQGETRTSLDATGNVGPLNGDGIRLPGPGFARFVINGGAVTGSPIIPVGSYLAAGTATLTAPDDNGTGTTPLFDQDWSSQYQAASTNVAVVIVALPAPTTAGAVRVRFGNADYEWSLDAADSLDDLSSESGSFDHLVGPQTVTNGNIGWQEWNAAPVTHRYFRFRVERLDTGLVEIRELELQRPKPVCTIEIAGTPVRVNHLEITPANSTVFSGGAVQFTAEASLSLGPDRYNVTTQAVWSSSSPTIATIETNGVASGLSLGETQIGAALDVLSATTRLFVQAAQDRWETLPDVPFAFGVSAGGGLATDGTYVYAADFSGDGDEDYIDLDEDGDYTPGEELEELGVPNGSVRFARFDPLAESWDLLPVLHPTGITGDAFSSGDLNGSLFYAGASLFYYQFRGGPNRCALYRYDLSQGLSGTWSEVWDLSQNDALIGINAGLVGVDAAGGPVIFHHTGGGGYKLARSTGLTNGSPAHVQITPAWPYTSAHFPRNGTWAYDAANDRIFHMSGDQLLQWDPSAAYAPAGFLDAVPNGTDDLAVASTAISSLKTTLGWDPGGSQSHPGSSLWGHSIVVVNDPSGNAGGPNGEDTGANVVYLVRGETSVDAWPFNEGRGLANNGDLARYFPATGTSQNLPSAPFNIGKGSAACYLNGAIYVLQGETRTSADDAGNVSPLNTDGIRLPGVGFARFNIKADTTTGPLVIPIQDYLEAGFATLTAPPDTGAGTASLFDQDWETGYEAASANPVDIIIGFPSQTAVGAARGRFGDTEYEWSLDAAESLADLSSGTGSFAHVFGPLTITNGNIGWQEWNASPVTHRYFRFRVKRLDAGLVMIRELELQRPKPAFTVEINGTPVLVNHLEIHPSNLTVLAGDTVQFTAEASLSLGPDRYNVTTQVVWSSSAPTIATVDPNGIATGHAVGDTKITAAFEALSASARLTVATVEDQDDDVSVAWIQRLPSLNYVWGSTNATRDGWPKEGSNVTWHAQVKNWYPFARTNVSYRWLVDSTPVSGGTVTLAPREWTVVDLVRPWSFDREQITFEIDPDNLLSEFSESNNVVSVWTDAITVAFWVEQSVYDYFHQYQHELGIGANGWEDWAQRQVARWNEMFAAAVDPIDAPQGVLDRVRLDKITIVPDGALPLAGGLTGNNPDNNDRITDLVWGFPSTLLSGQAYANHTDTEDWNMFYYEGSLIHELGHARYLIDCYGFNVPDSASHPTVFVEQDGELIAGTPYLPRLYAWWDHVHIIRPGVGNPFDGLMGTTYTTIDRYSTVALNLIAGHRATLGNYNAPGNIGVFINDLPASNRVQLLDGHGQPIADASVSIYRPSDTAGWYGKEFDNTPDLTFTTDALGRMEVGRNPFSDDPPKHTYGGSTMVALLKAEADGRVGFAFLDAGLFNMEYWRGHTNQGNYSLTVPLLSDAREIANVFSWPSGDGWEVNVIASGDVQPDSVVVADETASYQEGSWWVRIPGASGERLLAVAWPGEAPVEEWVSVPGALHQPTLVARPAAGEPGLLQLAWPTLAGYAYDVETSTNLTDWTLVPDGRNFSSGEPLTQNVPITESRAFYRLIVRRLGY